MWVGEERERCSAGAVTRKISHIYIYIYMHKRAFNNENPKAIPYIYIYIRF